MATRSKASARRERDSDAADSLKPLVVLALLGTILYGAWSVVAKSPTGSMPDAASTTASLAPQVEIPASGAASPSASPAAMSAAGSGPFAAPPPLAASAPPVAAAAAAEAAPTYLSAVSAPPPVADPLPAMPQKPAMPPPAAFEPLESAPSQAAAGFAQPNARSTAFASSWADAHDKLAAGRYAEALAVLSAWYDDASLGPEESQRLEDLLSQLAGSVIYSQQDLLQPPHIVAPGETLPSIAATLAVPWQLLAKINGVPDPNRLVAGESLKVLHGPFDAVVSVSRRRLSLQVGGNYAGSFPVLVGRQIRERVGATLPVVAIHAGEPPAQPQGAAAQVAWSQPGPRSIALSEGLAIAGVADPATISDDAVPPSNLFVAERDLDELVDILGQGSRIIIRQ